MNMCDGCKRWSCQHYLLTLIYKTIPIAKKMKLGSHTLMNGDMTPFTENVVDTVEKRIYNALSVSPKPKFLPIPPRTFLELMVTPRSVMINAPIGLAQRFHHSVSKACTLRVDIFFSLWIGHHLSIFCCVEKFFRKNRDNSI